MKENRYKSLWDFLKKNPKNLIGIIVQLIAVTAGITMTIIYKDTFDPEQWYYAALAFCGLFIAVCYIRIYSLYKDNKQ